MKTELAEKLVQRYCPEHRAKKWDRNDWSHGLDTVQATAEQWDDDLEDVKDAILALRTVAAGGIPTEWNEHVVEVEYHESHELLMGCWETDDSQEQQDLTDVWWATFFEAVNRDDRLKHVRFRSARGQRCILSQWQGYQWWEWSSHNLGCREALSADQVAAIEEAETQALRASLGYYAEVIQLARRSAAVETEYVTHNGEAVYDLCPCGSDLLAVAGPAGVDPETIDPDDLPEGFRWLSEDEWGQIQEARR